MRHDELWHGLALMVLGRELITALKKKEYYELRSLQKEKILA